MREDVSQANDPHQFGNASGGRWIDFADTVECLADDFQLAFDRGAVKFTAGVRVLVQANNEYCNP
jgi:hypothetical protein